VTSEGNAGALMVGSVGEVPWPIQQSASVLHVYPRRHACWDLRASWLPLAALATAWSKGCVKYFADLRSFIWVQTQTMQQFAVIGTLKPKAMVPQNDK